MPSSDVCSSDRKSTRLNSSHTIISYAVFCLKKKSVVRSEEHTSELQSHDNLVCRLLLDETTGKLRVGDLEHRATLEGKLQNYPLNQNISPTNVAFEPLLVFLKDGLSSAVCLFSWPWELAT